MFLIFLLDVDCCCALCFHIMISSIVSSKLTVQSEITANTVHELAYPGLLPTNKQGEIHAVQVADQSGRKKAMSSQREEKQNGLSKDVFC